MKTFMLILILLVGVVVGGCHDLKLDVGGSHNTITITTTDTDNTPISLPGSVNLAK